MEIKRKGKNYKKGGKSRRGREVRRRERGGEEKQHKHLFCFIYFLNKC
jgi:hypothetical protein